MDFTSVIGLLVPTIIKQLEEASDEGLNKVAEKNPKAHKVLLQCGYSVAKTFGSDIVASTENKYDDEGLAGLIEELEANAAEHSISLPG